MVMKKTVGEKIRSFRQQKKLTQEQLALGAEINPVFLGHLERNLKSPTITTLEKITRALGITMSELFLDVPITFFETFLLKVLLFRITFVPL